MILALRRLTLIAIVSAATLALNGCLISNMSGSTSGGLTTAQATVTLTAPSPCTVDTVAVTTTCTPVISVGFPGVTQSFPFLIKLVGYAAPITLYDPLIIQVPASMSNFAGSIAFGPPGTAGTPLSIIAGLTSVPIDATTNLIAEAGMQLVIIDFKVPSGAPFGTYTLDIQFSGTTSSIKVVFAAKVTKGAKDYYVPIWPCVTNFASVPAIPIPVTNLPALIASLLSVPGCVGTIYDFSGTPAGVEINQHGLTGSWYEPATDGQGFEVEIFPTIGSTQVSWFTFDTVAGGANRQRWYTLSGSVVTGQPTASLTIYQNIGGNFNAPPVTNGVAVGTATLTFDTCASGQLTYSFTDGSGRAGTITLTRITQNVTCSATGAGATNSDFTFSGNWYNATTSGQGFTVEVNPNNGSVFMPWYTYAPSGSTAGPAGQRWYTASGGFTAGSRSIALDIYETTGGVFDMPTVPAPTSVKVGTATLTFLTCSTGTLNYTFTGGSSVGSSGTIALTRIGPVPAGCVFASTAMTHGMPGMPGMGAMPGMGGMQSP
jgi:hypothetical protein